MQKRPMDSSHHRCQIFTNSFAAPLRLSALKTSSSVEMSHFRAISTSVCLIFPEATAFQTFKFPFSLMLFNSAVRLVHFDPSMYLKRPSSVQRIVSTYSNMLHPQENILLTFPSNAFMASARSLHTFNRSKKMNCNYHARLSTCR